eukprot:3680209-Prymnesium_polylepis.1
MTTNALHRQARRRHGVRRRYRAAGRGQPGDVGGHPCDDEGHIRHTPPRLSMCSHGCSHAHMHAHVHLHAQHAHVHAHAHVTCTCTHWEVYPYTQ